MPCICGKSGYLKKALKDKMQVWKEYEENYLMKEISVSGKLSADKNDGPCQNVTESDVVETLCSMKEGKAGGPNGVASNLLKLCRAESVKRLKAVANGLLD